MALFKDISGSAVFAGVLAAFVGFASSFAVILQGLTTVGASPAQAASGLMAGCAAIAVGAIGLSLWTRQPVALAWTTPGGAFLATLSVPEGGFAVAVGAFLVTSALIILAGLWRPLGRAASALPKSLANAMLAGVLLPLCLAPFQAIAAYPALALPIVVTWAVVARIRKVLAVPAAVVAAVVAIGMTSDFSGANLMDTSGPIFVMPAFSLQSIFSISIPLFIITMAAQNVTGIAVLASYGYRPDPNAMFRATGLLSLITAPFGAVMTNLAAITAAMCASPEVHDDPARRYWASVATGLSYIGLTFLAGLAAAALSVAPPLLIAGVAGLALLGALTGSIIGALEVESEREAAVVTFLITASGMTFFGIGGAFWGLLAGGALYLWDQRQRPTS